MALAKGDKILTEIGMLVVSDDDPSGMYWYLTKADMPNSDPLVTVHKEELHGEWLTGDKAGQECLWMLTNA